MRFIIFSLMCLSWEDRPEIIDFSEEDRIFKKCQNMKSLEKIEDKIREEIIIEYFFGSGDGNDNNFRSSRGDRAG